MYRLQPFFYRLQLVKCWWNCAIFGQHNSFTFFKRVLLCDNDLSRRIPTQPTCWMLSQKLQINSYQQNSQKFYKLLFFFLIYIIQISYKNSQVMSLFFFFFFLVKVLFSGQMGAITVGIEDDSSPQIFMIKLQQQ